VSMGFPFSPYSWSSHDEETAVPRKAPGAERARSEVQILKAEVERLFLIAEALWTIVRRQQGLEDEDLAELVRAVDLQDGRLDGRKATRPRPKKCPSCQRVLMRHRPHCIYCGTEVVLDPFER